MRSTVLIIMLAAAGLCVCGREALAKPQIIEDPTPPDFKELLQILFKQQALKLGTAVHHDGCVASETLGDYLATLIANGSEGEERSLTGSCAPYDPKRSQLHPPRFLEMWWECRVTAKTTRGGGRYELAVMVDQATRKMDTKTLACPSSL